MKLKYLKNFNTLAEFDLAVLNRELEEAVVCDIGPNGEYNDTYTPSIRETNNDNQVTFSYNADNDTKYYMGLELVWGPYGFTPSGSGESFGGKFMPKKEVDKLNIPPIYDGYRLYNLDYFTYNVSSIIRSVSSFDNSNVKFASSCFYTELSMNSLKIPSQFLTWPSLIVVDKLFYSKFSAPIVFPENQILDLVTFEFPNITDLREIINIDRKYLLFPGSTKYIINAPKALYVIAAQYGSENLNPINIYNTPECVSLELRKVKDSEPEGSEFKNSILVNSTKIENIRLEKNGSTSSDFSLYDIIPLYNNLKTLRAKSDMTFTGKINVDLSHNTNDVFTLDYWSYRDDAKSSWDVRPNLESYNFNFGDNSNIKIDYLSDVNGATDPTISCGWDRMIIRDAYFNKCIFNNAVPIPYIPSLLDKEGNRTYIKIYYNCKFNTSGVIDLNPEKEKYEDKSCRDVFPTNNTINSRLELKNIEYFKTMLFYKYTDVETYVWNKPLNTIHSKRAINVNAANLKAIDLPLVNVVPPISINGIKYEAPIINLGLYYDGTGYNTVFDFGDIIISGNRSFDLVTCGKCKLPIIKGNITITFDSKHIFYTLFNSNCIEIHSPELNVYLSTNERYYNLYSMWDFSPDLTILELGNVEVGLNVSACKNIDILSLEATLLRLIKKEDAYRRNPRPKLRIRKDTWEALAESTREHCLSVYTDVDIVIAEIKGTETP